MTVEEISAAGRLAGPGEAISEQELALAARNHGMPLEALRYDVTPLGLHYLLIHYDIPDLDPDTFVLEVGGRVRAAELHAGTRTFKSRAEGKAWSTTVAPRLRADFLVRIPPALESWSRSETLRSSITRVIDERATAVRGATWPRSDAPRPGAGSARRSILPLVVRGMASTWRMRVGTM